MNIILLKFLKHVRHQGRDYEQKGNQFRDVRKSIINLVMFIRAIAYGGTGKGGY